ncbi:TRM11 [Mytilus coruscus]|uniref:TRM11 n=1 Tax=Mytilus coruscus TaxID=42192 RepID=A0A6J8BXQ9_MYTCO|nr:TRM11 [Mytilus coruscus]
MEESENRIYFDNTEYNTSSSPTPQHLNSFEIKFQCITEIKAISELFGFTAKALAEDKCSSSSGSPYLMVELNSEKEARKLMSRTVLIKSLYEVWGHGATYKEVSEQVETIPAEIKKPCFSAEKSFRINVDTYNKKIQQEDKIKIIEVCAVKREMCLGI